ncbi:ribonuclease H-like domain-containing protein [Tanacetum coccineum]
MQIVAMELERLNITIDIKIPRSLKISILPECKEWHFCDSRNSVRSLEVAVEFLKNLACDERVVEFIVNERFLVRIVELLSWCIGPLIVMLDGKAVEEKQAAVKALSVILVCSGNRRKKGGLTVINNNQAIIQAINQSNMRTIHQLLFIDVTVHRVLFIDVTVHRVLVPRPPNVNIVRSMWLYKHKYNADGSLNRYKARLVANGRSQQQGIDCDETFSLVVKPATIQSVLSLAVSRHWPIHQLDVKNAFLHDHLTETVYMHRPPGFTDSTHSDYVCFLQKSLYGLKQAPDLDDIILTASSTSLLQRIISLLHAEFAMTDLGPINNFLGLQLTLRRSLDLKDHWSLILLYIAALPDHFSTSPLPDPICYPATRRSTSGYCVFLGDNLLTWSSKRQDTLSRYSVEAEYRGVANVVVETSWIHNLLCELDTPLFTATLVYCDNVSAVYMSTNPVQHQRTKHIEIDIHFVHDKVAAGHVRVLHVPS